MTLKINNRLLLIARKGATNLYAPSIFKAYKISENVLFGEWYAVEGGQMIKKHVEHYSVNEFAELVNILYEHEYVVNYQIK